MGKAVAVLASTGTAALLDAQEADLGIAIDPLAIDRAGGDGQCFGADDRCDQRRIAAGSQGDTLAINLGHHRLVLAAGLGQLDLVLDQIAADQCFWGGEADLVQEAIAPLERGGHFVDVEAVTLEFAAFLDVDRGSRRRDGQCAAGRAGQGGCRNLRATRFMSRPDCKVTVCAANCATSGVTEVTSRFSVKRWRPIPTSSF